jgi:hypothetical protein
MSDDAQRELQQRSLRNVRALLDKLEAEAATERRTRKWIAVVLVASAILLFCALFFAMKGNKGESRTIVVQPAGRTVAVPAPAPAPK